MANNHTIVLLQPEQDRRSRRWLDREAPGAAIAALVDIFESKLRDLNPGLPNITYELTDIFSWVDNMPDLSVLVFSASKVAYEPHGKAWIKDKINAHFVKQAQGRR